MIKFAIPIFLQFRTQQVFLKYLAKFQSITNSITHVFWTFSSENLQPPLIFLVPRHHFLKNTTPVGIMITISIEAHIQE